jgi:uncharacterized repeat protein (TIGR01451 family)
MTPSRTCRTACASFLALLLSVLASHALAQSGSADLSVTKTGPATAAAGTTIAYTIGITNLGPDDAPTVQLDDTLPAGTTFVSLSAPAGFTCSTPALGAAGTVTCTSPLLANGASAVFSLDVAIDPSLAGAVLTNVALVSSPLDPTPDNDQGVAVTLIGPFADLNVTKTGPSSASSGVNIVYDITLSNLGPDAAQSVSLIDALPAGVTFVSIIQTSGPVSGSCSSPALGANGTVNCTFATFPAGAAATFALTVVADATTEGATIVNTAVASSTTADLDPSNDAGSAFTDILAPAAELAIIKTAPPIAAPGADISYTLGLSNSGPSPAPSTSLMDNLPPGTAFVSLTQESGPAFTCATPTVGGPGGVTCTLASFASGAAATFTLVVTAAGSGPVTNIATVSSGALDPNPSNNSASATTVVGSSADLAVTKTAAASVAAGANISYSIGLSNSGPNAAATTAFADTLPAGTTFVSFAQNSGPAFTCTIPAAGAAGTVTCNTASLASGASASFTLVVQASVASAGTTITNTVSAGSATLDPNPANNSASTSTTVGTAADLAVTKTGPASVAAGTNISYALGIANNGPGAATTTSLTDALPAGTTFVSFAQTSGPGFVCTAPAVGATGTVTCNIATLASGAAAAFTLTVRAGSTASISNTASATSATADPTPGNNSATAVASVGATRTASGASATGSGTITATFTGGGATCSFSNAEFIPVTGHPRSPPAGSAPSGITFPHGLFDFTTTGCTPGSTLAFSIVYPAALPAGTQYWKYGPTPTVASAHWYILPATIAGNTVTFNITDGGLGDDDLAANGTIVDQGGPGVPAAPEAVRQVPTLSEWMQLLLAGLILAMGLAAMRRKAAGGRRRAHPAESRVR